jgi:ribosome maturation factor RimP
MSVEQRVMALISPVAAACGVELVDVEVGGGLVRVFVDEPGGIGSERLGLVTKAVSKALDEDDPIPGHYVLEVSSPGLERPLRTAAHFARAVGQKVSVKTVPGTEVGRRLSGVVLAADEVGFVLAVETDGKPKGSARVEYHQLDKARTVFEWGPAPKPGGPRSRGGAPSAGSGGAKQRKRKGNDDEQG